MKRIKSLVLVGGLLLAFGAAADECYDNMSNGRDAEAVAPCTMRAELGDAMAQFNLGILYADGRGTPQDYKEAIKWYRKAAEQGYAPAQFNLGVMYDEGNGVPQDYKKAAAWFTKAAEQGQTEAQHNLGFMYLQGRGVPQDIVTAYVWWNVAAAQGQKVSREPRDKAVKNMTPSQIEKGQELSKEYFKKYTN